MRFALLGGDDRMVRLVRLLRADGHDVAAFALEKALPGCAGSAAEALEGADCVVLPLPAEKGGGLNAPFADGAYTVSMLLRGVPAGTPVCAGNAGGTLAAACAEYGLPLYDYGRREGFCLANAELTAEGALSLLLDGPRALKDSRILVCGYGRIGRALAAKLAALGAILTVAARSAEARAEAEAAGFRAVSLKAAPAAGYEAVVNTVPAPVFGADALATFSGARLIELASAPYGFDFAAAEEQGRQVLLASGLPGKCAPESAAAAVRDSLYSILEERNQDYETADRAGADRLVLHLR